MDIQIANIPTELKNHSQWICWDVGVRDDKETKLPKDPNGGFAQTDDPSTWTGFLPMWDEADNYDGIGFVFTKTDEFVGIDLDKCRNAETGEWEDWALDVMNTMGGYIEISPSGTGAHVILKGEIPGERRRKGNIEIYEDGRYFTVTGNAVSPDGDALDSNATVGVNSNQEGLNEVYTEYLLDGEEEDSNDDSNDTENIQITPPSGDRPDLANLGYSRDVDIPFSLGPDPDALTKYEHDLLVQAKKADNGYGFALLWRGNWEEFFKFSDEHGSNGYSQSEADMIFCNQLAFWCSGDPVLVDRFVRASGLMREKWNEAHYSDGTTYGERTVEKAIARVEDTYDDDRYEEVQSRSDETSGDDDEGHQDDTDESGQDEARPGTQKKATEARSRSSSVADSDSSRSRGGRRGGMERFKASTQDPSEDTPDADTDTAEPRTESSQTRDRRSNNTRRSRSSRSASPSDFAPVNTETEDTPFAVAIDDDGVKAKTDAAIGSEDHDEANEQPDVDDDPQGDDEVEIPASHDADEFNRPDESEQSLFAQSGNSENSQDNQDEDEESPDNEIDPEAGEAAVASMEAAHEAKKESDTDSDSNDSAADSTNSTPDSDSEGSSPADSPEEDAENSDTEKDSENTDEERPDEIKDGSKSKSGGEIIPSELGRRVEDLEQTAGKLEEELEEYQEQLENEIQLEENKIARVYRELEHYERIVDNREDKIDALQQILFIMCKIGNHPVFDEIAEGLSDDDIPLEDILDESFIERIKRREQEHKQAGNNREPTDDSQQQQATSNSQEKTPESNLVPAKAKPSAESEDRNEDGGENGRSFFSSFF